MNPDKRYLNANIYSIIRRFEIEKFNNIIPKEKYRLISELIVVISESFATTINPIHQPAGKSMGLSKNNLLSGR